jgi:hypothetical protein
MESILYSINLFESNITFTKKTSSFRCILSLILFIAFIIYASIEFGVCLISSIPDSILYSKKLEAKSKSVPKDNRFNFNFKIISEVNELDIKINCNLIIQNSNKQLILGKSVIIDDLGNKLNSYSFQESSLFYLDFNYKIEIKMLCPNEYYFPKFYLIFDSNIKTLDILNKDKPFTQINQIIDKLDITKMNAKIIIKNVFIYDDADPFSTKIIYNAIKSIKEYDTNIKNDVTLDIKQLYSSHELYESPDIISSFEVISDNNHHIYIRSYRKFFQILPYYFILFYFLILLLRGIFIIIDSNNIYLQFINSFYDITVSEKRNSCDSNNKSIFKEKSNFQNLQNENKESSLIKMSCLNSPVMSLEQTRFVEEDFVKPLKKEPILKKNKSFHSDRKYIYSLLDLISFLFAISCCKKTSTKEKLYNSLKTQLVFYLNPLYYFKLCSLNEADVMESITDKQIYSAVISNNFENFIISRNNSQGDKRKSESQFKKSRYYNEFDNNEKLKRIYASLDNTFII